MLIRNLKYSVRFLIRSKGFSFAVVATLSACIGVNVAIFAIVHSVLLRPLPVPNSENIVLMSNRYPKAGVGEQFISSSGDYFDRRERVTALTEQAAFRFSNETIDIDGTAQREKAMTATPSLFHLLQVSPLVGRTFSEAEGTIGAEQKIILSYGLWQQICGGNPGCLGSEVRLNGRPFTVVGVMPQNFVFVDPEVQMWIPAAFTDEEKTVHHNNDWYNIGRLQPGATIQQVQAQVNALNAANLEKFPKFKEILINAGFHSSVEPLQEMVVRDVRSGLYLLWSGSIFVLLIGVLNVANLAFARLTLRKKEFATRLALGAGRLQLLRQFVAENLLLAVVSCVGGVMIGALALRAIAWIGVNRFPRAYEVRIDSQVIWVAVLMAAAASILLSSLSVVGISIRRFHTFLRDSERTGTGAKARPVRQVLVVAQIGFAFALLVGAGLLLASFRHLLKVDPGYRTDSVVTASVSAPTGKYDDTHLEMLVSRSLEAVRQIAGVAAAGASTVVPLGGRYDNSVIVAEGYAMKPGESVISPIRLSVTPGYLETMGISLLQGRFFHDSDNGNAPRVVIVDERLAKRFWPGRDPIGQRMFEPDANALVISDRTIRYTVVGVVRSVRLEDLSGKGNQAGAYYFPYTQRPSNNYTIVVRTAGNDAASVLPAIRAQIAAIDPEMPLFDIRTMAQREELSLSSRRTSMLLGLAFGVLALFLAAFGIYGVLAYLVAQRRKEIGIRVALGSTNSGIVKLVLREGLVLVAAGLILGIAGSISLRSVVQNEIYGVAPLDPLVLGCVAILFAVVALAACIVPARRAMQVDPAIVLSEQ
ncbi:MAG TPA: ABC transporter permease [Candidatus Sulfotelmatobacter sp.]|nr:ABC transporter permease [Candidatus Sulfotelmatobacter sp.]